MTHAIHVGPLLRIRILLKDTLSRTLVDLATFIVLVWKKLGDEDFVGPMPMNLINHPLLLLTRYCFINLPFQFILFSRNPTFFLEANLTRQLRLIYYACLQSTSNIQIHGAYDQIVDAHLRILNLNPLLKIKQIHISPILMRQIHTLSIKSRVCFLVVPVNIIRFLPLTIICGNWRMMRNLLRQELITVRDQFIGLSKQWVKWLVRVSFGACGHSTPKNSHNRQPQRLIFLCARHIQNVNILHGRCTCLEQA